MARLKRRRPAHPNRLRGHWAWARAIGTRIVPPKGGGTRETGLGPPACKLVRPWETPAPPGQPPPGLPAHLASWRGCRHALRQCALCRLLPAIARDLPATVAPEALCRPCLQTLCICQNRRECRLDHSAPALALVAVRAARFSLSAQGELQLLIRCAVRRAEQPGDPPIEKWVMAHDPLLAAHEERLAEFLKGPHWARTLARYEPVHRMWRTTSPDSPFSASSFGGQDPSPDSESPPHA